MSDKYQGWGLTKRIFKEHLHKYHTLFTKAIICMLLCALSTAALPYLLQPVFDDVFTTSNPVLLGAFCGAVLLAFIVKGFASYGESVTMTTIGQGVIADIQKRLFVRLMDLDLVFFQSHNSGELLSRFTNDVNLMRNSVANTLVGIGRDCCTLILLIALMFYRDWVLAIFAFIIFPTAILPIAKIGRKMRKVTFNAQEEIGKFTKQLTQVFQGIRVIKSYCGEQHEILRAKKQIDRIFQLVCKTARVRSISHPIIESIGGVAIISVIAYGGWQIMHHDRTAGEVISFIGALILAYEPLKRLSHLNASLQEGLTAAFRVFEIIDTKSLINNPIPPFNTLKVLGKLTFKNVSFAYKDNKKILDNIELSINPGECIAIVGASGAGKSTIINLIPRFFEVMHGQILIDNKDIKEWDLNQLRKSIALVSQETALFDLSVKDNVLYGNFDAPAQSIKEACIAAAANIFIDKIPAGYEAIIGENGVNLSGGQRQRLSIARAMIKQAPILLLDEATSALDTESERQVQVALRRLMRNRTTIMVAHRLSTIIDADMIYVLHEGKFVEKGTHNELIKSSKIYYNLWHHQQKGIS